MTGKSLAALLAGEAEVVRAPDEPLGVELFGNKGLRKGDWKISAVNPPWSQGAWGLYNLADDPGETKDLSAEEPEKFREMMAAWENYVEENGVVVLDR